MPKKKKTGRRKRTTKKKAAPVTKIPSEDTFEESPEPTAAPIIQEPSMSQDPVSDTMIQEDSLMESMKAQEVMAESSEEMPVEQKAFILDNREKMITTFTAGGVVLSFGLSLGSALIVPLWPAGSGLLATLGVISGFGAFMARESL